MSWLQENGIWIVTWLLIIVGLVGTLLPILPGQVLIIVAAGAHWWVKRDDSNLGWWTFVVLASDSRHLNGFGICQRRDRE